MNDPESELNRILYQLRREHQEIEAPASLEEQLAQRARLNAVSKASLRGSWMRGWTWGLGFALVAIAAIAGWWLSLHASSHPVQQIVTLPAPTVQTTVVQQATTTSRDVPHEKTGMRQTLHTSSKLQKPVVQGAQAEDAFAATTSFVPLPVSEGLPEPAQQSVIRTQILTSSLAQYGLDVPATLQPQLVSAEFLVGEDGLPRAIRFVR